MTVLQWAKTLGKKTTADIFIRRTHMKRLFMILLATVMCLCLFTPLCADNPIVQTSYTADPAPLVYNDTVYVYVGEDAIGDAGDYNMPHWRCYSTTDMVNWTDHGAVMRSDGFEWALPGTAWASQCVERNGKFYLYTTVTTEQFGGGRAIGVAVSDSPTGPFKDALGKPLVGPDWTFIDPTVFIDDDGQAYLYWGNPNFHGVKLKKNMIALDGEIKAFSMTYKAFGQMVDPDGSHDDCYEEGPWVYKRNGIYYLVYAGYGTPESICYSISDSPMSGWKYQGIIMNNKNSFTIHPGIIEFKGKNYFFYHGGDLKGSAWNLRAVCVEEFEYNEDGSIPLVVQNTEGVKAVATLDPYKRVEAETICWSEGLKTVQTEGGIYVTDVDDSDYIKVENVDFGEGGAKRFSVKAKANAESEMAVILDSLNAEKAVSLKLEQSTDMTKFEADVGNITGVHDVYITFITDSEDALEIDCWQFLREGEEMTEVVVEEASSKQLTLIIIVATVVIIALIVAVALILKKKKQK